MYIFYFQVKLSSSGVILQLFSLQCLPVIGSITVAKNFNNCTMIIIIISKYI
jgi:hypothetical protein